MEKLVENLNDILTTYQFKSTRYLPVAGWKHIITRIGNAYADGELNIPGDIGELSVGALRDTTEDDLQFDFELWAWVRAMVKNGAETLIALSGTGKEEAG